MNIWVDPIPEWEQIGGLASDWQESRGGTIVSALGNERNQRTGSKKFGGIAKHKKIKSSEVV